MKSSNDLRPTGIVVAESLTSSQTASFQFDTLGFNAASVVVSSRSVSESVFGSEVVGSWISDAINGTDSIDFLFIGDSNVFYQVSGSRCYGYFAGFHYAMLQQGATMYGTAVTPLYRGDSSNATVGYLGNGANVVEDDANFINATVKRGSTRGPEELSKYISGGPFSWNPESTGSADFLSIRNTTAYGGSTQAYQGATGIYLDSAQTAFNTQSATRYRLVRGKVPASRIGSYQGYVYKAGGNVAGSRVVTTSDGAESLIREGSYEWVADEMNIAAATSTAAYSVHYAQQSVGDGFGIQGELNLAYQSVYRPSTKGFAVSAMHARGGAKMSDMVNSLLGATDNGIKLILAEIRKRQIRAGGTGRVCMVVEGGSNADTGVPQSWATNLEKILDKVSRAWSQLGFPAADLAFLAFVSQQRDSNDTTNVNLRPLARSWALGDGRRDNLTVVETKTLYTYAELETYATGGDTLHLTSGGYDFVSDAIISALVASQPSTAAFSTFRAYESDDRANWSEMTNFSSMTAGSQSFGNQRYPRAVLSTDRVGRKRFLRVDVTPGGTADIAAFAVMSQPSNQVTTAADVKATLLVQG